MKGEFLLVHKLRHYRLAPPIYWALMSNGLQICISPSHDFRTMLVGIMEWSALDLTLGVASVVALMCLAYLVLV